MFTPLCSQKQHAEGYSRPEPVTTEFNGLSHSPLAAYQLSMMRVTVPDDAGNIRPMVAALTAPFGNR